MGRQVIIGLTALVAILTVVTAGVLGREWIAGFGGKHEAPSIMIITRQVLKTTAESSSTKPMEAFANTVETSPPKSQPAKIPGEKQTGRDEGKAQAANLNLLVEAMEDSLGGRVSQDVEDSHRFRLIASSKVVDAMDAYAKESSLTPANLIQLAGGMIGGSSKSGGADSATVKQSTATFSHGITAVGRKVGADYVLVVTIGEPVFSMDVVPADGGQPPRLMMIAQPIVNCEIFQTNGKLAYRFNKQIDKPIVEVVEGYTGTPVHGLFLAKFNRLNERISEAAAQQVLAWTLDKIAPAKIISTDGKIVINRGSNDGVTIGAIYPVQREVGESIKESDDGADLGRVRVDTGSIVIQSVQDRLSTAASATGGPFLKGDIVQVVTAKPGVAASGSAPTPTPGGSQPFTIAVDQIDVGGAASIVVADAISSTLSSDPHLSVLPRSESARLSSERARNARASGDFTISPDEGLRQSNALVDGDCSSSSRQHNNTISVSGVSRTVSSSTSTASSCTLRATAVDGRLLGTAQASGASVNGAAEAAAKALILKLDPLAQSQTAPPPNRPSSPTPQPTAKTGEGAAPKHKAHPAKTNSPSESSEIHF